MQMKNVTSSEITIYAADEDVALPGEGAEAQGDTGGVVSGSR